MIRENTLHN